MYASGSMGMRTSLLILGVVCDTYGRNYKIN